MFIVRKIKIIYVVLIMNPLIEKLLKRTQMFRTSNTGLFIKDEILQTYTCTQFCLVCVLSYLIIYYTNQNTKQNAETKNQASSRHIFRVQGRLYSLPSHPLLSRPVRNRKLLHFSCLNLMEQGGARALALSYLTLTP